jgi:hypothetical protein
VAAHRFHGDERRFEVTADFIAARFPQARTAADVAGGEGMLARRLRKLDFRGPHNRALVLRPASTT